MQLTAKMANIFLIMFHFGISCWGMFSVFRTEIKWKGKVSYEDKTSVLSWYFSTRLLNSKFRKQMDTLKYSVYRIYGCIHWFACLESWKIQRYHNSIETSARRDIGTTTHRIRDWQGASSLFSSCYWDLLGPSSTESSTELLGPSSSEWQVWKGTTTWGASVIADLGQVMAAACGTPALGPWIGQSMIKLWFRACSSHSLIMYSNCLFHVHSKFRSTKEYALPVSI